MERKGIAQPTPGKKSQQTTRTGRGRRGKRVAENGLRRKNCAKKNLRAVGKILFLFGQKSKIIKEKMVRNIHVSLSAINQEFRTTLQNQEFRNRFQKRIIYMRSMKKSNREVKPLLSHLVLRKKELREQMELEEKTMGKNIIINIILQNEIKKL